MYRNIPNAVMLLLYILLICSLSSCTKEALVPEILEEQPRPRPVPNVNDYQPPINDD